MNEMKERFYSICRTHIQRDGIENLLAWLSDSDFFTAPASTKYHGSYEGGLLEHSLNVYDCLKCAVDTERFFPRNAYSDETITISALFHDVCKVNLYVKGYRNVKENGQWTQKEIFEADEKFPCGDHSDKSIIILQNFIRLLPDEILAIRAHMGGYDNAARGGSMMVGKIFERCKLAVLLHLSDMQATYLLEERKGT